MLIVSFAVQKLLSLIRSHLFTFVFIFITLGDVRTSLVAQTVKRLSTMQEIQVRSLGQEDPLEKENGNLLQYSCLENPMEGGAL